MFIQNTSGNLRIKIDTEAIGGENVLEDAELFVKIKRREHEITKEAVIVNLEEQIAICYFEPKDLCYPGNYDYQVVLNTKEGYTVKSAMGSFYVSPSLR